MRMTHPQREGRVRSAVETPPTTVPPRRPDCDDLAAEIGSQLDLRRIARG